RRLCNDRVTYPPKAPSCRAGGGVARGLRWESPSPSGEGESGSARTHDAQAVAQQGPGGDALGDLAVDHEGWRTLKVVLLLRGARALLQLLDAVEVGKAGVHLFTGHAARLEELVELHGLGDLLETHRRRRFHRRLEALRISLCGFKNLRLRGEGTL